jgi:hypothetical protein
MDGVAATVNVGWAGNHSFDLYAREDGIEVDKIVLTQNANYTPGSSSSCTTDTSTIENRMKFFRPNNSVIDFQASNDTVGIDPTGDLNGDSSGSGSGSCTASCMKFSKNASNLVGDCCTCDGLSGSFVQGGNPRTVLCSTN